MHSLNSSPPPDLMTPRTRSGFPKDTPRTSELTLEEGKGGVPECGKEEGDTRRDDDEDEEEGGMSLKQMLESG